uniref:Voltage-gated sodium channel beta subunit 1 n=1 Tax=Lymnaea stagnalis TaxID=6523 RepID=A0A0U2BW56_LYMST|nr:voltage-gated sodium channel beta subunit 1 [Lymnaea stagnalis]
MMRCGALTVLAGAWLVFAGGHVIDKRQAIFPNLVLCVDSEARLADQSNIYVKSPYFGFSNYLANTRCQLTLRSGADPLTVSVQFDAFDLELEARACSSDSLCVGGVQFCGNWQVNQRFTYVLPPGRNFTLVFRTDGSVTARGFQVQISAVRYDYQPTLITSGGVGSSSGGVQTQLLSYNGDYEHTYQDKCAVDADGGFWNDQTTPYYYNGNSSFADLWRGQASPRDPFTDTRYYQTSPDYYRPSQHLDRIPILYFLFEAQAALNKAAFKRGRATDNLLRAYDASGGRAINYKK